jgi:hypothetical protein
LLSSGIESLVFSDLALLLELRFGTGGAASAFFLESEALLFGFVSNAGSPSALSRGFSLAGKELLPSLMATLITSCLALALVGPAKVKGTAI